LKAGDLSRAHALADGYFAEEAAPASLNAELREILEQGKQVSKNL
jgi:hypothetical protein